MKSAAIVLGLALAANAQVDNELATSLPYHPSGADLVRNAGWGRSQPIHTPPTHTTPYYFRKDDAADDELVQTFYSPSGADLVKYAKQSQQTVYRPTAHVVRDDATDDELMVYYTKDSQGNRHYEGGYTVRRDDAADDELAYLSGADLVKYAKQSQQTVYRPTAHVVRDDEGDDELMVYYTKDSQGNKHYQGGYTVRRDDAADDELVQTFYSPSGADLVKYAKQSQQTVYRPTAHVVRDDATDDELMVYYTKDSQGNRHYEGGYTVRRDDAADDELAYLSGADLVKYAKQSQQTVYRPTAHVVRDDEGDDELMVYYTKDSQGNKHYQGGYTVRRDDATDDELMVYYTKDSQGNKHYQGGYTVRRDDAADDELVQTFYSPSGADLVKYAKQSQQTVYRPTAHVVRDDEADDELMVYYTKDSNGVKHYQPYPTYTGRDDADDELAYLGQLIKEVEQVEKKSEIKRHFRHL